MPRIGDNQHSANPTARTSASQSPVDSGEAPSARRAGEDSAMPAMDTVENGTGRQPVVQPPFADYPRPVPPEFRAQADPAMGSTTPLSSSESPLVRAWAEKSDQARWRELRAAAVKRASDSLRGGRITTLRSLYAMLATERRGIANVMHTEDAEEFGAEREMPWTTVVSPMNRYRGFYAFLKGRMRIEDLEKRPVPKNVNRVAASRGIKGETTSQAFSGIVKVSFWRIRTYGFECLCILHPPKHVIDDTFTRLERHFTAAMAPSTSAEQAYSAIDEIQRGLGLAMPSRRGSAAIAEMVVEALENADFLPVRQFQGPVTRDLLAMFSNSTREFRELSGAKADLAPTK